MPVVGKSDVGKIAFQTDFCISATSISLLTWRGLHSFMVLAVIAAVFIISIVVLTLAPASVALSSSALRSRMDLVTTLAVTSARHSHICAMAASRSALLMDEEETTLAAVTLAGG